MADPPNPFESSTIASIPDSWEQESNVDNVFAWLRPMNDFARVAFHQLVESMLEDPNSRVSERRFMHLDGKEPMDTSSVSSSDDEAEKGATKQPPWVGAFKFSTAVHPRDPAKGWFIGTGRGTTEVDIMIGPPDLSSKIYKVRGCHARLFIHEESCQPTVEALHSMQVSGATGAMHVSQLSAIRSKVLEDGHKVEFGRCAYLFSRGNAWMNGMFVDSLPKFMKAHHGKSWAAHPILSATSTGAHLTMGEYTFPPGAFAAGCFGEVTAGWSQNGSAVAVKRFKSPTLERSRQHQEIMGLIGRHPNIVELLLSSSNLEPTFPATYCVYSPLALADLADIIQSHTLNLPAQITLLMDYLRGLAYLHDEKGIMHRDIKPENLGLLSLCPPRGIILDLDSATSEETSNDPTQGTVSYQAPEIINLSLLANASQRSYGRSVDVWALGMSAFCALRGKQTRWSEFGNRPPYVQYLPGTIYRDFVTANRLDRFHDKIKTQTADFPAFREYSDFLRRMTLYHPQSRFSAFEALTRAGGLNSAKGEPTIVPKVQAQGTKRKIGEVG